MLTLVLGGARSGKSRIAQSICESGSKVTCIATARLDDDEMRARISRHRRARPRSWITIEEPLAIADAVAAHASSMDFILLDCLTLWLSNFCSERRDSSADSLKPRCKRKSAAWLPRQPLLILSLSAMRSAAASFRNRRWAEYSATFMD